MSKNIIGLDNAIGMGLHQGSPSDMHATLRVMLDGMPRTSFSGLRANKTYYDNQSNGGFAFKVVLVTPSGRQVVVSRLSGNDSGTTRLHSGSYHGDGRFIELNDVLISLVGVTHEAIVTEAVERQLPIPSLVKRHYPAMFVEIPARFTAERVKESLLKEQYLHDHGFKGQPTCAETCERWIEHEHSVIADLALSQTEAIELNRRVADDWGRYIQDHMNNIDYFRWLQSTLLPDQPFYSPAEPLEPEPEIRPPRPKRETLVPIGVAGPRW